MFPVELQQPGIDIRAGSVCDRPSGFGVLSPIDATPHLFFCLPRALKRNLCPFFVGGLLLIAAGLKSYSLLVEPVTGPLWQPVAVVALEVFCGLALLLGVWPQQIRWGALAMFAAFLSFSLGKGFSGASSCGCLGQIDLSPWAAVILDIVTLLALWLWRPICNRPILAGLRFSLAVSLPLFLVAGLTWAGSRLPFPRLQVTPSVIDLGTVPQGSRTELTFFVRNPHDVPVIIHSFEISCHCLKPNQPGLVIPPGQEENLCMVLDLNEEPDFSGTLLIDIKGRMPIGQTPFVAQVQVQVEDRR
jgi:hypothetical protein